MFKREEHYIYCLILPVVWIAVAAIAFHQGMGLKTSILAGAFGGMIFYLPIRVGLGTASWIWGIVTLVVQYIVMLGIKPFGIPVGMIIAALVVLSFIVNDFITLAGVKHIYSSDNPFDLL